MIYDTGSSRKTERYGIITGSLMQRQQTEYKTKNIKGL